MTTEQLTLTPRARNGDPSTSHQAASSVDDLREKQKAVFDLLRQFGPSTHEDLILWHKAAVSNFRCVAQQSDSGIRTRCSELVAMGLVEDSGERRKISTGRKAIVWRVKEAK